MPERQRAAVPASHADILEKLGFAHVATIGSDGSPQSSPVWFRWDGAVLSFSTTKPRQKYRNLVADPRVAMTILDPDDPYRHIEIRGVVEIEEDPDGSLIHELAKRYMGAERFEGNLKDRVIVRIVPARVNVYG